MVVAINQSKNRVENLLVIELEYFDYSAKDKGKNNRIQNII